jgi:tetratricopeptide (TPR) repeat protein
LLFVASSCQSAAIQRQTEVIRRQEEEIGRLRRELDEIAAAQTNARRDREDCRRAFAHFDKARAAADRQAAKELYREGLKLCPTDEIARFELGKLLVGMGRNEEARREFEAALRLNPNFSEARKLLDALN